MSGEWMSAGEIASDLGMTYRHVHRLAKRDGWDKRPYKGQGGGYEYAVASLPDEFRNAILIARQKKKLAAMAPKLAELAADAPVVTAASGVAAAAQSLPKAMQPGSPAEVRRHAKTAVLNLYGIFCLQAKMPRGTGAREMFCALYNGCGADGQMTLDGRAVGLAVPGWVRDVVKKLSPNSLFNWGKRPVDDLGGLWRGKVSVIDRAGPVRDYILGSLLQGRMISAHQLRAELVTQFGEMVETVDGDGVVVLKPLPIVDNIRRWCNDWAEEHKSELMLSVNPDKWRGTHRIAVGTLYDGLTRPNELWEIDASPADMMLLDADGKAGRYSLYVLIDLYTRRLMVSVTKTPRTEAALMLLRRGIEKWGMPDVVRTDQGSDFVSHAARRFFALTGILHDDCTAYSPEQKGGVERHVQTVQHGIINQLPGFIGHSVADRKKIEGRKAFAGRLGEDPRNAFCVEITQPELQQKLDDWAEFIYARKPHRGLGGKTPFARLTEWSGVLKRIDDPQKLALLLAPVPQGADGPGVRTVTKKGVQVESAFFFDPALLLYIGKKVFVVMDPRDMGAVWVFAPDCISFIARAINVERLGADRAEVAAKAKALQAEALKDLRKEQKRLKQACDYGVVVDAMLADARAAGGKIVDLPKSSQPVSTPALDALAQSMRVGKAPEASPVDADEAGRMAALEAEMMAPAQIVKFETADMRFKRLIDLEARIAAGEAVSVADREWMVRQNTLSDIKIRRDMLADFGPSFLTA